MIVELHTERRRNALLPFAMGVDGMLFNAPATNDRIESLLERLYVHPGGRVVDVGCGGGEMLAILAESFRAIGTGIDPDEGEINIARKRRPTRGQLNWHCAKIEDVTLVPGFDAAICVGAAHAFGPLPAALPAAFRQSGSLVRDGGRILIGLGYWRQPPPQAYLDATGLEATELLTHEGNMRTAEMTGLRIIDAETSTAREWHDFEAGFLRAAERGISESPDDPTVIGKLKHWRSWNAAVHKWGHETMGFAFYIFEK